MFTLILIAIVAVVGGVVYVSAPKDNAVVDFEVYAEDFSMVVNTEKQIKYTLSINPSHVYVTIFEDDSTILTVEKKQDGAFFANALRVGLTTLTILAKHGGSEATKAIRVLVVSDESEIVDPIEVPENFEGVINKDNLVNCSISENTLRMNIGVQAMFTVSLSGINLENVYIENVNDELAFQNIDIINPFTYSIESSQTGVFSIRIILNNSIVYVASIIVEE